jgi:hypothetical protein
MRSATLSIILLFLCACGSSSEPNSGAAASLTVVAGGQQRAPAGTELPHPVVVKVTDAHGVAVPNQIINFVVISGAGSVFAGTARTNAQGEAKERWTLGTVAGEQVIEARAVDQSSGDPIVFGTITATALPGPMTVLSINPFRLFTGQRLDFDSVTHGTDQYGNEIPDLALTVTAEAPLVVEGTKLSRAAEGGGTVTVSSGGLSLSRDVFVLRDLHDLIGAAGGWECAGQDNEGHTRKVVEFVVESVQYDPYYLKYLPGDPPRVTISGRGTTTWTFQDGTTETVASGPSLPAFQHTGYIEWDLFPPLGGGASLISDNPLSYAGGNACYYWYNPSGAGIVEVHISK